MPIPAALGSEQFRHVDFIGGFGVGTPGEDFLIDLAEASGGAVLGFSYYDIMARIQTLGPDDAWRRLKAILDWYQEVQASGGYRKYYDDHDGTLQGGGPPGGLGLDQEFFESVMLPSVMVYGFMGLEPTPTGLIANPQLPADWPSLTVTDISYRDWRFSLTADPKAKILTAKISAGDFDAFRITMPEGWRLVKEK